MVDTLDVVQINVRLSVLK